MKSCEIYGEDRESRTLNSVKSEGHVRVTGESVSLACQPYSRSSSLSTAWYSK